MSISSAKLRANLGRILDGAIETGMPVEIRHTGVVLTIVPPKRISKLGKLKRRAGFVGDPDDLVNMDWLKDTYVR